MTRVIRDPAELREWVGASKRNRYSIGFVPTMGALHAGHRSLMARSWGENDRTVVSLYVNPLQFGPHEDFDRYPRAFESDLAMCTEAKVDVLFAPAVETMKPPGFATMVRVAGVTDTLEGARRPGHFDGVATIVTILFNAVQADRAYFGQKDFQQTVVVRRMVSDLRMPVQVVICPTMRDPDGLAMSSRNVYLTVADRPEALRLPRALDAAERAVAEGETDADAIRSVMAKAMESPRDDVRLDYAEVVHPDTLAPLTRIETHAALLAVLRVGKVRLLDNRVVAAPGVAAWKP